MSVIKLPAPPSTNNLYANRRGGGRKRTDRYNAWRNAAGWDVNRQSPMRVAGPVILDITCERPRVRSDVSNRIKAVEDLLVEHGIIEDDSKVVEVRARWGQVKGCEVRVWEAA